MSSKTHPLDDVLGMDSGDFINDFDEVVIPEDPNLDTIIKFALNAYKQQMDIMSMVEPKNRIKYMEVCERFLGQAKDAMDKKEKLKIQKDKMSQTKSRPQSPQVIDGEILLEDKKFDRNSLYELKGIEVK